MSIPAADTQVERIAFRRGLALVLMTLFLPGSAQLVAGNRRLGRIALRTWGAVVLVGLSFLVLAIIQRSMAISVYAFPATQWLLAVVYGVLGLGWIVLLLDSWRIARPINIQLRGRLWLTGLVGVLVLGIGFASFQASAAARSQAELFGAVFGGGGTIQATDNRINVLLVGSDADPSRPGVRTDSMMVASIDAKTGRTVLFSLPRNLQHAPIPKSSPLHASYPNGYWCADQSCLLNAVYLEGVKHASEYPGARDPGIAALREVIGETLGLKLNYYAMVDIEGFQTLIDALGGITLDISRAVPIGGGSSKIEGYIQPGKGVHLDGYQAIWFARAREGSSDYDRMARQKCVINAMTKQLTPANVLSKFNAVAAAGGHILATDIPTSDLGRLVELAEAGRHLPLASVSFAPPLIQPVQPDFPLIRATVKDAIAKSREADTAAAQAAASASAAPASASATAAQSAPPAGTTAPVVAKTAPKATAAENSTRATEDLSSICGVS